MTDIFYGILLFFGMIFAGFYLAAKVGGLRIICNVKETAPESLTLPGLTAQPVDALGSNVLHYPTRSIYGASALDENVRCKIS